MNHRPPPPFPCTPLHQRPTAYFFGTAGGLHPLRVAALMAACEGTRPNIGRIEAVRISEYWVDQIPPGSRPVLCPVCRKALTATIPGITALAAVFQFRAVRLNGLNAVATFTICQACAWQEAPAIAAALYP